MTHFLNAWPAHFAGFLEGETRVLVCVGLEGRGIEVWGIPEHREGPEER